MRARQLAVQVVADVLDAAQPLDQAWARATAAAAFRDLEPRDRAFSRSLAAAVLRRQGEFETVLRQFIEKPLPKDRGRLSAILLVGVAQMLGLGLPPHAVVDLAVEAAQRDRGARRFAKLTNAVLRRVSERGRDILAEQDAVSLNMPAWLLDRWTAVYGTDTARAIAEASLREAPLDLSVARDPDLWRERLSAQLLPTGSLRLAGGGRIEDLPGYADGAWWVQDAAAALVTKCAGAVAGLTVADLCAAPGGKTASLASAGAEVTAVDVSQTRLARLRDNLARLHLKAEVVCTDIAAWQPGRHFDVVLLDAPCSATGTIRRHPDLIRSKGVADIERLAVVQARLLETAAELVRPGGMLIYSTCSLEPEEGVEQVAAFLRQRPDYVRETIDPAPFGGDPAWMTALGELRTLPFHMPLATPELSGCDGFYVARLRRSA